MADPVTVLGALSGTASLAAQLVDGCIKCYHFYSAAVEMPEKYEFLQISFQWEQCRFLRFCLNANLLHSNGSNKYIVIKNSKLLQVTLGVMRHRFLAFDKASNRYRQQLAKAENDSSIHKSASANIMDILQSIVSSDISDDQLSAITAATNDPSAPSLGSGNPDTRSTKQTNLARKWYTSLKHAKQEFQNVALQPRRWKWVAIDKAKFSDLVDEVAVLNTRLEGLFDDAWKEQTSHDLRSLTDAVESLKITQVVNGGNKHEKTLKPLVVLPYGRDPDFNWQDTKQTEHQSRRALLGTGGVGKSQIAIEYLYRLQAIKSQHIFWVYASNASSFEQGYREIASYAGIVTEKESELVGDVYKWLSDDTNGLWTMILDNVDDKDTFSKQHGPSGKPFQAFIPTVAHGSILITSRNRVASVNLVGNGVIYDIEPMMIQDAVELLKTRLPLANDEEAAELVDELDRLPLAITYASAYIKTRTTMSISKYLNLFKDEQTRNRLLENADIADNRRDWTSSKAIIATWQISFDSVCIENSGAADLLALMSMFDNHSIPKLLLAPKNGLDIDFDDQIEKLLEYCLIKARDDETYMLHRLIQFSMSKWLTAKDQILKWQDESIFRLHQVFPTYSTGAWSGCQQLLPHVEKVVSYENGDAQVRPSLLNNMGAYYLSSYAFENATQVSEEAIKLSTKHFGVKHKLTQQVAFSYGARLSSAGNDAKAAEIFKQLIALVDSSDELSSDAFVLHCALGSCLISMGKHEEAKKIEKSLAKFNFMGNKNLLQEIGVFASTGYATVLAYFEYTKQYAIVEACSRLEFERLLNLHGYQNMLTLIYMEKLVRAMYFQGKEKKRAAVDLESKLLANQTTMLGSKNGATLRTMFVHGDHLIEIERFEEGIGILLNLREILQQDITWTVARFVNVTDTIAIGYLLWGDYAQAELFYREVVADKRRICGKWDKETIEAISYLADTLEMQRKSDEAQKLREEISSSEYLSERRSKDLSALAGRLFVRSRFVEAEIMGRLSLDVCEKIFGKLACRTRFSAMVVVWSLQNLGLEKDKTLLYREYDLEKGLVNPAFGYFADGDW